MIHIYINFKNANPTLGLDGMMLQHREKRKKKPKSINYTGLYISSSLWKPKGKHNIAKPP